MIALKKSNGDVFYDEYVPKPSITQCHNVLIKVCYAGICRTDLAVAQSAIPSLEEIILGHEFCGVVEECSADSGFCVGDVVSADPMRFGAGKSDEMCGVNCNGAFAEYIVAPAKAMIRIPHDMLSIRGAYLEPVAASLAPYSILREKDRRITIVGNNRIAMLTKNVGEILGYTNLEQVEDYTLLAENSCDTIVETEPQGLPYYIKAIRPKGMIVLKSRGYTTIGVVPNTIAMKEINIVGVRYGDFQDAVRILSSDGLKVDELFGDVYELRQYREAFAAASVPMAKKIFFKICVE